MDESTKDNNYIPTAGELKLIEVLVNPDNFGMSISDQCNLAGVSRTVYYDAIKKPEFVAFLHRNTLELLKGKVGNIINATYKFAIESPTNHQDRKLLLEMAQMYTPKQIQENTGAVTYEIKVPEFKGR